MMTNWSTLSPVIEALAAPIAPVHAIIDAIPGPDVWVIAGSVASPFIAVFTGWLAWSTRNLSKSTQDLASETKQLAEETATLAKETVRSIEAAQEANAWADRHHQEQLFPIVSIKGSLIVRTTDPRGATQNPEVYMEGGSLVNIGGGPATSVKVTIEPLGCPSKLLYIGMIGGNSEHRLSDIAWLITGTQQSYHNRDNMPFTAIIESTSLFGSTGSLVQCSHSGKELDLVVQHEMPHVYTPRTITRET